MPSHHPRCVQHGLVVATDNMCVLCRKEARASSQPAKKVGYNVPLTAAALTAGGVVGVMRVVSLLTSALLLMAGGAYFLKMPPPRVAAPPPSAPEVPHDGLSELDRTETAELAKLDRSAEEQKQAELERLAKQAAELLDEQDEAYDSAHYEAATQAAATQEAVTKEPADGQ